MVTIEKGWDRGGGNQSPPIPPPMELYDILCVLLFFFTAVNELATELPTGVQFQCCNY